MNIPEIEAALEYAEHEANMVNSGESTQADIGRLSQAVKELVEAIRAILPKQP